MRGPLTLHSDEDAGGQERSHAALGDLPHSRRLGLLGLFCVTFFTVSGGPFGLEELVGAVGPGWAVLLILLTPLLLSLPIALMVAELSSLMPEEGGYYVWVRDSLGPFWGLQEGWWTLGYSVILMAIFPVMFVNYLGYFLPGLSLASGAPIGTGTAVARWSVAALVIAISTAINWHGVRAVGRHAQLSGLVLLGVFGPLLAMGLLRPGALQAALGSIQQDIAQGHASALLLGLSTVIFNYSGWDNVSTYAGEVDDPRRTYPRALAAALAATVLAYLLPVVAGLGVTSDSSVWSAEAGWPVIARRVGGPWMGAVMTAAALASSWSLFTTNQLSVSRLPYVMACDGWLPHSMARASLSKGAPTAALAWSGVLIAAVAAFPFGNLVVMFVLLYVPALLLEFMALAVMRLRRPEAALAFRIPGGWPALSYVCLAPLAVAATLLAAAVREQTSHASQLAIVASIVISGLLVYAARRH